MTDYLNNQPAIAPFYRFAPDRQGIDAAIAARDNHAVNRKELVSVLQRQYELLDKHEPVTRNIQLLANESTYTICTAHQPNLMTGYLYFIYKILHAIRLAEELSATNTDKHFVPVYYMGSEDNDLEELGTFRFRGTKYVWDGDGQTGAVGRMNTESLKQVFNELFKVFGPPGKDCDDLQQMVANAYLKHKMIGEATQYLVNELFGRYGLVVINPDDAALKQLFVPVMEDEILRQASFPIIATEVEKLGQHYKVQAHPRELNLFYLRDNLRTRIGKTGEVWKLVDSDLQFTKEEILTELHDHPERFSPNVMLRGLFQETILPNVAFIGGGAEVAYWMQLKALFDHYQVFYPCILLRQSVLWVAAAQTELREKMGLSISETFTKLPELVNEYVKRHAKGDWQTADETAAISTILLGVQEKATAVDESLRESVGAAVSKIKYQLAIVQKKMLRAEKKKLEVQLKRLERLRAALFPGESLQERIENFAEYYLDYGPAFLDIVKAGIDPFVPQFLVVSETATANS